MRRCFAALNSKICVATRSVTPPLKSAQPKNVCCRGHRAIRWSGWPNEEGNNIVEGLGRRKAAFRHSLVRMPTLPSQHSIVGQGQRGCLRPNRPAKSKESEGPPQILRSQEYLAQLRPACCRGSQLEVCMSSFVLAGYRGNLVLLTGSLRPARHFGITTPQSMTTCQLGLGQLRS
jgi:hypothetical protein